MKKVLITICVFGGLLFLAVILGSLSTNSTTSSTSTIATASVTEILGDFNRDPVAANTKYVGQWFQLNGRVDLLRDSRDISAMAGYPRPFDHKEHPLVMMTGDGVKGMVVITDADVAAKASEHTDITVFCQIIHYGMAPAPLVFADHCSAETMRETY